MDCSIKFRKGGHKQWVCTCPPGYIFHSERLVEVEQNTIPWNGCGPHEWKDGIHVLNTMFLPDEIQPCCNAHDVCYGTMYSNVDGLRSISEFKKHYKEFNRLDWGVCDDLFQACNQNKANSISWYNIPKKAWVAFTGKILSSAVINKSADYFTTVDDDGNKIRKGIGVTQWCVKKERNGLCMYN